MHTLSYLIYNVILVHFQHCIHWVDKDQNLLQIYSLQDHIDYIKVYEHIKQKPWLLTTVLQH